MNTPLSIDPRATRIITTLLRAGYDACCVGGCVREHLRGVPGADTDVATNASLTDIQRLFPDAIVVGKAFSVARVDGIEVASFRQDGPYSDYRHPDYVRLVPTIMEDLSRRDFTINAMALRLDGTLIDPFGGMADVQARVVRFVGDAAARLREDPIRALRACRFVGLIDGVLDDAARAAIVALRALLAHVPRERIQYELNRMLLLEQRARALFLLEELGLLPLVLPRLAALVGVAQNVVHAEDCWTHTVLTVQHIGKRNLRLRLAALLHDIGKPRARTTDERGADHFYGHEHLGVPLAQEELRELRYSNAVNAYVTEAIRFHLHRMMFVPEMRDATIRRLMSSLTALPVRDLLRLQIADLRANLRQPYNAGELRALLRGALRRIRAIEAQAHALKITDLAIDGDDVQRLLGVPPGPTVGAALRHCFAHVLQNPALNTRPALAALLRGFQRAASHNHGGRP